MERKKRNYPKKYSNNTLVISKASQRDGYRYLYSNSTWFNTGEYYMFEIDEYCLIIKRCTLKIDKSARKFSKTNSMGFIGEVDPGEYIFSEDSTEDRLIVDLS